MHPLIKRHRMPAATTDCSFWCGIEPEPTRHEAVQAVLDREGHRGLATKRDKGALVVRDTVGKLRSHAQRTARTAAFGRTADSSERVCGAI